MGLCVTHYSKDNGLPPGQSLVRLIALYKISGFLNLEFLSCDTNPLHVQHVSEPLHVAPEGLGDKRNLCKDYALALFCSMNDKVFDLK